MIYSLLTILSQIFLFVGVTLHLLLYLSPESFDKNNSPTLESIKITLKEKGLYGIEKGFIHRVLVKLRAYLFTKVNIFRFLLFAFIINVLSLPFSILVSHRIELGSWYSAFVTFKEYKFFHSWSSGILIHLTCGVLGLLTNALSLLVSWFLYNKMIKAKGELSFFGIQAIQTICFLLFLFFFIWASAYFNWKIGDQGQDWITFGDAWDATYPQNIFYIIPLIISMSSSIPILVFYFGYILLIAIKLLPQNQRNIFLDAIFPAFQDKIQLWRLVKNSAFAIAITVIPLIKEILFNL